MTFISFGRVLRIGLVDFWRNRWLSLAATMMMTMTIFIIALFVMLNLSINQTAKTLEEKLDIAVYFKDAATDQQIQELQSLLMARSDVKEVQYISREEALQQFRERSKYRTAVLSLLDQGYGNSLPRSLSVKATAPQSLDAIATYIKQPPYDSVIERLSYEENKSLIDKYISGTAFVKKIGIGLSILFTTIAVLVIYNTIRLTIFMRREEIEIMQLVGATGWYIRFPFIVEGILYGLLATVITSIILASGVQAFAPIITRYVDSPSFDFQQFFAQHFLYIILIELGIGVIMGALCSYLAVRKHLR